MTLRRGAAARNALAAALLLAACGWAGCVAGDEAPDRPRHLVLVTIDTMRADHFGASRGEEPLTPRLSELTAAWTVRGEAASVGAATSPGIAAILTGLLPRRTGVLGNRHMLPPEVPTLASILAAKGFRTGAVVSNPVLGPGFGFARGFDSYRLVERRPGARKARGEDVVAAALAWLDASTGGDRVFLWVHLFEPHGPYEPPAEVLRRFPASAFGQRRELDLLPRGRNAGRGGVPYYQQDPRDPRRDAREYLRRYAAEVRAVDGALAELFSGLTQRGLLAQSVVAVTADHGEALDGDHGFYFSHEHGLTQDQIAVPLLVDVPGAAERRLPGLASTLDLLPTLLEALGVPVPKDVDGTDLLAGGGTAAVAQSEREEAIIVGRHKLARDLRTGEVSMYDLLVDPDEAHDLSGEAEDEVRRLGRRLAGLTSKPPLARAEKRPRPSRDEAAVLDALGYL